METFYIDNYLEEIEGGICTTIFKINYNLGLIGQHRKLSWKSNRNGNVTASYFLASPYLGYHLFQGAHEQTMIFIDLRDDEMLLKKFADYLIPAAHAKDFFELVKKTKAGTETVDILTKLSAGIPPVTK